ncbi:hypothetical protein BHO_0033000 [Borrelia hermsii YBT]|nr:hypothetical protein BHO_0033000 [Borrelia hermsii YBT]
MEEKENYKKYLLISERKREEKIDIKRRTNNR